MYDTGDDQLDRFRTGFDETVRRLEWVKPGGARHLVGPAPKPKSVEQKKCERERTGKRFIRE